MSKFGIFILARADGSLDTACNKWLSYYDATRGRIVAKANPAKALTFPSSASASACYLTAYGTRHDGRPNRPLTAYTVEILRLPHDEEAPTEEEDGRNSPRQSESHRGGD